MIGIKIKSKKKLSMSDQIRPFDQIEYVYIPIEDDELLVKKDQKVSIGDKIAVSKNGFYRFSSVNGKIIDTVLMLDKNNLEVKCLKIKNTFENKSDQLYDNDNFERFTKDTFIETIKDAGIVGLGGAGFPTYLKYDTDKINTIIVNAVECEPYITADCINSISHIDEILKTLKIMIKIFSIDTCYIGVKKKNYRLRELFITATTKTPEIKIVDVPNLYPMGWEKSLVRYVKHVDYDKTPLEKGIVVSNISTIYAIYEALRYQKPLYEKVVTFSGEGIKNPQNLLVKIGTRVKDVLDTLELKGDDIDFTLIAGGPMMGKAISSDDLIIDSTTNCILVLPWKERRESPCLRCGKCVDNCPVKICPVLVKDNIDDLDSLKRLYPERCIECGICSFICPAKIPLRDYVKQAKDKCKED